MSFQDVLPSELCESRRSSSAALSGSTVGDKYDGPDANILTTLLLNQNPDRPRKEVDFDSRESTPFVMMVPPGIEHWRSVAQAAKDNLARFIGKLAADEIRQSISYMHYWKTEAAHYAEFWSLVAGASAEELKLLRQAATEDLRASIKDIHYWETEAMHYQRHAGPAVYDEVPKPGLRGSLGSATQPSDVRKNDRASQRKQRGKGKGKEVPVSARLRSRDKVIKKGVGGRKKSERNRIRITKPSSSATVQSHRRK